MGINRKMFDELGEYKLVTDYNNADWKMYSGRCKNYAFRNGKRQDSEDFAQFACEKIFKGRKATIKQLFIDYLRKHHGDTRSSCGTLKRGEYGHRAHEDFDLGGVEDGSDSSRPDYRITREAELKKIDSRSKEIMINLSVENYEIFYMYFYTELNVKKIAMLNDISELRVSQVLGNICKENTRSETIFSQMKKKFLS